MSHSGRDCDDKHKHPAGAKNSNGNNDNIKIGNLVFSGHVVRRKKKLLALVKTTQLDVLSKTTTPTNHSYHWLFPRSF